MNYQIAFKRRVNRLTQTSTFLWLTTKSGHRKSVRHQPSFWRFLRAFFILVVFVQNFCMAHLSSNSMSSSAEYRLKNRLKAGHHVRRSRRCTRLVYRTEFFRRKSMFAYSVTTQPEFEETLSQFFGAGMTAVQLTSCWLTWTSRLKTMRTTTHRLNQPPKATNSSSSSTKSLSMPTTTRCRAFTSTPCPARPKRASASFRIDGTPLPYTKYRPNSAKPWSHA